MVGVFRVRINRYKKRNLLAQLVSSQQLQVFLAVKCLFLYLYYSVFNGNLKLFLVDYKCKDKLCQDMAHPNSLANLQHEGRPLKRGSAKKHRRLSVTEEGWQGCLEISSELGISVSEILESLGRGEFILSKPLNKGNM